MKKELRKKAKKDFEKDFIKLINTSVFGKIMENVRKHRNIRLVNIEKRRDYGVRSKLSQYKAFYRESVGNRNEKNSNIYEKTCLLKYINIRNK